MKKFIAISLAIGASVLLTSQALAFPDKPVSYVIPFGPGGESDITARHQQQFFQDMFGQDLVISYKPGGGGAVGWAQLNSMKGDGYTVMGVNLPHIIIQPLQKNVGFKTNDITAVHMFHYTPDAIVVKADSAFKTLNDLVAYAKENPKRLTMSGSGKASANHLAQIRFDKLADISTTYVAFKGTGNSTTAMLGEQVKAQWGYTSVGAKQGDAVRLLAVATEKRHSAFPNVPTFKELGYDLIGGAYRGVAVPKGASEDTRKQLADIIAKINANSDFRARMERDGMELLDIEYGAEMDTFMASMVNEYTQAAKDAGLIE